MFLAACKVISNKRKLRVGTWGLVGLYLLHPTMVLGVFLGAVLFLPLVWLLPEDWREVSRRSEHSVPSSTKQQRRQEVLARRSLDKKLYQATKRWRRVPRINGLTKALLTTARLFPIASTSLPCQLAVPSTYHATADASKHVRLDIAEIQVPATCYTAVFQKEGAEA